MIAALWAEKIINKKKIYDDVPTKLKEKVYEILIESGLQIDD